MARFVLEGEWTGYRSSQRRIVHREIITEKNRAERLKELYAIVYTDGTSLLISVREAKPREKIEQILGYSKLIRDAERHGGSRVLVADLVA